MGHGSQGRISRCTRRARDGVLPRLDPRPAGRPSTDNQLPRDLTPGAARIAQVSSPGGVHDHARSSEALAFRPRVSQSSLHSLHDQAALEFGDGAQHRNHPLAGGRAGVELLRVGKKLDALDLERSERRMVPGDGIEPPTPAFSGLRSTTELPRHGTNTHYSEAREMCQSTIERW